ncbi:cytochrome P450 [Jimgerdemannia flammicorona]|uniref:Cytochrome P450 n=1 Tax=Jimgerdemannia flammicorona TaxID=994334 RepID=A0A433CXL2_9FUNG|nr:cytochrome P450 [Jimgerdemannia flammicorona]
MSTALTPHSVDSYLLVASGFIAALLLRRLVDGPSAQERIDANLPAFPPGLPFIGNVHQVAGRRPELQFTEWSKTLGPIFTVKMGVKRWIVLNSIDIVKDLIVDRGNIYSSRDLPEVLLNVLFRGDMGAPMPFMSYGDRWRQIRRIGEFRTQHFVLFIQQLSRSNLSEYSPSVILMHTAHSALTKAKINNYQPIIDIRSNFMLKSLYEASCSSPENVVAPVAIFDFYTVSTMFAVIFGVDIKPNDERIKRGNEVTQEATRLIGLPEQLMEFFPLLKNMPIKTAKLAAAIRSKTEAFWGEQYAGVKKRVQEGTAGECVLREVIATQPKERLGDLQQSHIGSILNSAGSETTSITIQWMCAILAHYPEIQEKAFAEIEQVVGLDRLPTENDGMHIKWFAKPKLGT